jgi:hypothetical protein
MAGASQDRSSSAINLGGPTHQFGSSFGLENKEPHFPFKDEGRSLAQQENHNKIQISMDNVMDEVYKASGNTKGGPNM